MYFSSHMYIVVVKVKDRCFIDKAKFSHIQAFRQAMAFTQAEEFPPSCDLGFDECSNTSCFATRYFYVVCGREGNSCMEQVWLGLDLSFMLKNPVRSCINAARLQVSI